jgi:hypothetical protein
VQFIMLTNIFSFAALAGVHTGIAVLFAHAQGGHSSPVMTGVTSFGFAVAGILSGAFTGHHIHDRHNSSGQNTGAAIYGLTGYAIGSAAGYFIR